MRRYIRIVLALFLLFIIVNFFFRFFYNGRDVDYNLKQKNNKYYVHEKYIKNKKGVANHYYVEIKYNDVIFNFRFSDSFKSKSYIVDKIYSFNDEQHTCILPILSDGSIQTEILCKKENTIYPYSVLKNESLKLDSFAKNMEEYGYSVDMKEKVFSNYGLNILTDNIVSSHMIVVPSYKGVYLIDPGSNKLISSVELFKKDVYKQPIQTVVSNYYVVADYDSSYSFNEFKVINLDNKKISKIISNTAISMDSYIQGVVDNSIYLIDRSNKKQYKIDVFEKSVSLVGNSKKGILYYNGTKFQKKSIYEALNNNLLFEQFTTELTKYDFVHKNDGINYSYLKKKDGYDVYISYDENPSSYTYGFHLSSIERIEYIGSYLYYVDGDSLYCYSSKGVLKILDYSELFYNPDINIWVYKNKNL